MRRAAIFVLGLMLSGCESGADKAAPEITLATTTTLRDSGLLDMLLPLFEQRQGVKVRAVVAGSGEAMQLGRRGDVDVLLTHSPALEKQFVADGFGLARRPVMKNDFIVVGPPEDPAGLAEAGSAAEALRKLAAAKAVFISRGDQSGTHAKELQIWKQADMTPSGDWYLQGGGGMAATLRMADEKRAYTLTDRGTFLTLRDQLDLKIAYEGDPVLENVYSVTVVNPEKHKHVHLQEAQAFADFLQSAEAKQAIEAFGKDRYGESLFQPLAAAKQPPTLTPAAKE